MIRTVRSTEDQVTMWSEHDVENVRSRAAPTPPQAALRHAAVRAHHAWRHLRARPLSAAQTDHTDGRDHHDLAPDAAGRMAGHHCRSSSRHHCLGSFPRQPPSSGCQQNQRRRARRASPRRPLSAAGHARVRRLRPTNDGALHRQRRPLSDVRVQPCTPGGWLTADLRHNAGHAGRDSDFRAHARSGEARDDRGAGPRHGVVGFVPPSPHQRLWLWSHCPRD